MKPWKWLKPYWKCTDEETIQRSRQFAGLNDLVQVPLMLLLGVVVITGAGFEGWVIRKTVELMQNSKDQPAVMLAALVCTGSGVMLGLLLCLSFMVVFMRRERHLTRVLLKTWDHMKELEQVIAGDRSSRLKSPPAGSPPP